MGDVIRKKKGGRELGWYIRWVDLDGKRKQRASHQPTKAAARAMLVQIEARVARGRAGISEPEQRPRLQVSELCERWLAEFTSPRIKDLDRYRSASRIALRRILPHLGHVQLEALTREHIERARDALSRTYRPNTVRDALRPLGACMSWAVRTGLIQASPTRGIDLPRRERSVEHLDAEGAARLLTEAERRARSGGLRDWSRYVAITLALHAGLRRGELFGLRWQDLDLSTGRLTIARSYAAAPKNGETRHLRLPPAVIPVLTEWRSLCPRTREDVVCPVFHSGWGMSSRGGTHGLPELLAAAGCGSLSRGWHALRHTFASHFVMSGGNILTLQKILGHSDIQMTLVYAHLAPDFLGDEMARVRFRS